MALFAQPYKINPIELTNTEANPDKNIQDNGSTPPLLTQPHLLRSPWIDTPYSLDSNLSRLYVDKSTAARQACKGNLRGVHLTAADDTLLEFIRIG